MANNTNVMLHFMRPDKGCHVTEFLTHKTNVINEEYNVGIRHFNIQLSHVMTTRLWIIRYLVQRCVVARLP